MNTQCHCGEVFTEEMFDLHLEQCDLLTTENTSQLFDEMDFYRIERPKSANKVDQQELNFIDTMANDATESSSLYFQEQEPREYVANFSCAICYRSVDELEEDGSEMQMYALDTCGHLFHNKCLETYFNQQLLARKFVFLCPDVACTHDIDHVDIRNIFCEHGQHKVEAFFDERQAIEKQMTPEMTRCLTPGCCYKYDKKKEKFAVSCPLCSHMYCLECNSEWSANHNCFDTDLARKASNCGQLWLLRDAILLASQHVMLGPQGPKLATAQRAGRIRKAGAVMDLQEKKSFSQDVQMFNFNGSNKHMHQVYKTFVH